jgi:hypothetical protein
LYDAFCRTIREWTLAGVKGGKPTPAPLLDFLEKIKIKKRTNKEMHQ